MGGGGSWEALAFPKEKPEFTVHVQNTLLTCLHALSACVSLPFSPPAPKFSLSSVIQQAFEHLIR